MNDGLDFLLRAILIGAGATAVMDIWAVVRQRLFAVPSLDYAMVGRWIGHLTRGRFMHARIAASPPVRGERVTGWIAHYAIGIVFAAMLLAIAGAGWARQPTIVPALAFGLLTVVAPFFIMQPGMGAGFAASRTPNPAKARVQSLITHAVFGVGLYLSAFVAALLIKA